MAVKRSDGIATRRKLLESAARVFAREGFHDARVADICRRAKANGAAVNYYFGHKDNLYVEAWRHAFEKSLRAYPPDGGVPATARPEERLRGQIAALLHRIMDPASLDFDIAHKEMANPTGLLAEVMHRSLEPLRQMFLDTIRALLGPAADERDVSLCEVSVHTQCFGALLRERHWKSVRAAGHPCGPSPLDAGVDVLAEHILRFSLAGIRAFTPPAPARAGRESTRKRNA